MHLSSQRNLLKIIQQVKSEERRPKIYFYQEYQKKFQTKHNEFGSSNPRKITNQKKGWRRFLSFFTPGKSKSKKVAQKNDQSKSNFFNWFKFNLIRFLLFHLLELKTLKPVISSDTKAKKDQVKLDEDVLLNSEASHIIEVSTIIWMLIFGAKTYNFSSFIRISTSFLKSASVWVKKKGAEKSKNKHLSSKTTVEVYDAPSELFENLKAVDVSTNEAGDGDKTECKGQEELQLDVEYVKDAEVSNWDSGSHNLTIALKDLIHRIHLG